MPSCSVRVVCRFRPTNKREMEEAATLEDTGFKLVFEDECNVMVSNGKQTYNFSFDRIFDTNAAQEEVYEATAKPTVEDVLQGYNGTIFAYGQTGAGKTFTMFGPEGGMTLENRGVVPRTSAHIFDFIDGDNSKREYAIKCSFLEIYKEVVRDLLNPKNVDMKIRESPAKGVWVDGLTEEFVTSEQDIADLITIGDNAKAVSATQMNSRSSRSHSLFMIIIEQKEEDGTTKMGKLNLVDLAGSEKIGKTGATGQTLEEAKKINQSLSALGNCIHALTESKRGHIPYRDSTLTRILQESLGGNTKTTLMIACSPHQFNVEETIGTLMFGKRAKTIKNTVKVNKQKSAAELAALIDTLKKELASLNAYNLSLEKQIEYMKGPDYDPTKPLPKELTSSSVPKAIATLKPEAQTRARSLSTASSPRNSPGRAASPLMHRLEGEVPTDLAAAKEELKKLRESTSAETATLRKDVAAATATEEEYNSKSDASKSELKKISEETEILMKTIEEDRKQHATEIKKLEKEKTEKKREVQDITNQIQDAIAQKKEMESSIAQTEESILLFFTDNENSTAEKQKLIQELQEKAVVLEDVRAAHAIVEKEANAATQDFEQAKERCMTLESKKKALRVEVEEQHSKTQQLQIATVKAKAEKEILTGSLAPLETELLELKESHSKSVAEVATLEAKIKALQEKDDAQKAAHREKMVSATLRGYVICTRLKEKGTPHEDEAKYTKLIQEFNISADDLKKALTELDESKLVGGLKRDAENQQAEVERQLKEKAASIESRLQEVTDATKAALEYNKGLVQKIEDLQKQNEVLQVEVDKLKAKAVQSADNQDDRKLTESGEQSANIENTSKSLSDELETVTAECDRIRADIENSRKGSEVLKNVTALLQAQYADFKAKINNEEETMNRLSTILTKETRRVGSETITSALHQKRIDDQKRRIVEFEEELTRLNDGNESMRHKSAEYEAAIAELEQHIKDELELLQQAQAEILEQKRLRLEQSKRNRKVFKPVQKKGIWRALEEKIDLSDKRQKLRSTASPFLVAAAQEHERSMAQRG